MTEKKRQVSLYWSFGCGAATCAALSIQYYATGGCAASRSAGRSVGGRQVSDQMCCPVGMVIGAVGMPLTAVSAVLGVLPPTADMLSRVISGKGAVVSLALCSGGLFVLSIVNLCWVAVVHASGAAFFFVFGYILLCIECRAFWSLGWYKPANCAVAVSALPVSFLDTLTAEWFAILAIGMAVLSLEFELAMLVAKDDYTPPEPHEEEEEDD